MTETGYDPLLLVMPISTSACSSHALAITDKDEDRKALRQSNGRGDNEGVLKSHLGDPRCDATAAGVRDCPSR